MTFASHHGAAADRAPGTPRHGLLTRILHAALAAAIVVQLAVSLIMDAEARGDAAFELHEYGGLAAFALALAFWLLAVLRRRGTPVARLVPWFSQPRRAAVMADLKTHLSAAMHLRLPAHDAGGPLASAIHGAGLLLVTAMALSGAVYYAINTGDPDAGGLVGLTMIVHEGLANLVWAYLIGHGGMALLAHHAGTSPMGDMWSIRPRAPRS